MDVGIRTCITDRLLNRDGGWKGKVHELAWAAILRSYPTAVYQQTGDDRVTKCESFDYSHTHRTTFATVESDDTREEARQT